MAKTPEEMCGKVITPRRVCGLTLNHNGGCEPTPPAPIAATNKCGKVVTPHRVCNREIHTGDCEPIAAQTEKCGPAQMGYDKFPPTAGILQSVTKAQCLNLDSPDALTNAVKNALATPAPAAAQGGK